MPDVHASDPPSSMPLPATAADSVGRPSRWAVANAICFAAALALVVTGGQIAKFGIIPGAIILGFVVCIIFPPLIAVVLFLAAGFLGTVSVVVLVGAINGWLSALFVRRILPAPASAARLRSGARVLGRFAVIGCCILLDFISYSVFWKKFLHVPVLDSMGMLPCKTNQDCPSGVCNLNARTCASKRKAQSDRASAPKLDYGVTCSSDSECESRRCLAALDVPRSFNGYSTALRGRFCSSPCDDASPAGRCPEGSVCLAARCYPRAYVEPGELRAECDRGAANSCRGLAQLYEDHAAADQEMRGAWPEAAALLDRACERDLVDGCVDLGRILQNVQSANQDLPRAARLLEKSCSGGDTRGCYWLGALLLRKDNPGHDAKRALSLLKQACDSSFIPACNELGDAYASGAGGTKDLRRALATYLRACDQESAGACVEAAALHESGQGIPKNPTAARKLRARACKLDSDACEAPGKSDTQR